MNRILVALLSVILCVPAGRAEVKGGSFDVKFERTFGGWTSVLAADDQFLYVSDTGVAVDDLRPPQYPRQAEDGTILGYSPKGRQYVVRLLVCDRATGEIVHEFAGPVTRRPRVSGFELPLTSPPLFLDDGFVFITADWHLQRIKLPVAGEKPKQVWDLDIPTVTKLTPRLNDDIGYLMPAVTRCDDTLLFTFNSAPDGAHEPLSLTMVAVNLADGKIRWTRTLGPGGALDRSSTCLPLPGGKFAVATAQGEVRTYSVAGDLLHALRPAPDFKPSEDGWHWGGDVWDLFRLDPDRVVAFGGRHAERGKEHTYPMSALVLDAQGRMEKQWQSDIPLGTTANLAAGTNLYQRVLGSGLSAFSLKTGKEIWNAPPLDSLNCSWAAPVVHEGFVYLTTADGIQVYRDGPEANLLGTVEFIERSKTNPKDYSTDMPSDHSAPVIHGGIIYVAAGHRVYALKLPLFPSTAPSAQPK